MNLIQEAKTKRQFVDDSKKGANYSKGNQKLGKNRYERRRHSSVSKSTAEYNKINMNTFFKRDILTFAIPVRGETANYTVTLKLLGILDELKKAMTDNPKELEWKDMMNALTHVFNNGDIYVHCTCLHPTTKIKLLDGTNPTVEELMLRYESGEKLYVYSVDEKGDFKPGEIEKVWKTGVTDEFVKVTLDNNETILTTRDHLYMLRDGTYVEAQDLCSGQSLMPMYFDKTTKDYDTVKFNSTGKYHSIYKEVAKYFKEDEIELAKNRVLDTDNMSYDVAIHHIDFNKHNNNPENLKPMTAREHWDYHASISSNNVLTEKGRKILSETMKYKNDNPTEAMLKTRTDFIEKGHKYWRTEEGRRIKSELMTKVVEDTFGDMTEEEKEYWHIKRSGYSKDAWERGAFNTERFHSARIREGRKQCSNPEIQKTMQLGKIKNSLLKVIQLGLPLTQENYNKVKYRTASKINKYFTDINEAVAYFKLNHKVVNVETVKLDKTDVYDIKVKDFHNFTVDAGVVLHNCPDWKYRFQYYSRVDTTSLADHRIDRTAAGYSSVDTRGLDSTQAPVITNPNNDKGDGCKHSILVLNNSGWRTQLCNSLINYIKRLKERQERLYQTIVFPAVYGVPYTGDVQLQLFNPDTNKQARNYLPSSRKEIDQANKDALERTRFKPGNKQGIRFAKNDDTGEDEVQLDLELDNEEETT